MSFGFGRRTFITSFISPVLLTDKAGSTGEQTIMNTTNKIPVHSEKCEFCGYVDLLENMHICPTDDDGGNVVLCEGCVEKQTGIV